MRLFLLVPLLGCGERTPSALPVETNTETTVRVVRPMPAKIHREVSQPGSLQAFEETPLYAKIAGYVKKWHFDRGDEVRQDQELAELSVPELVAELEQKEALVRQAQEQVKQAEKAATAAEAAVQSAQSQIKEAEAAGERAVAERKRARSQHERLTRAGQGGVIEHESIEETRLAHESAEAGMKQAEARVQSAKAQRDESKAKWDKANADVRVADANRQVADKNHAILKAQVQYLRPTAPYKGIITARHVNTGDFVRPPTTGQDKPLYVVRRTDRLRTVIEVPETDADWVQKGVAANLRFPALAGLERTGEVARTSWSLDQTTRTLRAEIDILNPPSPLRPGIYVYVTLTAELSARFTLPRSAVFTEGDVTRGYQSYCYQVENNKVRRLQIELGPGDAQRVEVRHKQAGANGPWLPLTGDEEIVQGNLAEVHPGQAVTIRAK